MEEIPLSDGDDVTRTNDTRVTVAGHGEGAEVKAELINQVLDLQKALDDLSQRVDTVKDENLKLKSENQILGQYIENLMAASNVFQATTQPKAKSGNSKPAKRPDKR